jgi:hypothetical protein
MFVSLIKDRAVRLTVWILWVAVVEGVGADRSL